MIVKKITIQSHVEPSRLITFANDFHLTCVRGDHRKNTSVQSHAKPFIINNNLIYPWDNPEKKVYVIFWFCLKTTGNKSIIVIKLGFHTTWLGTEQIVVYKVTFDHAKSVLAIYLINIQTFFYIISLCKDNNPHIRFLMRHKQW